MIVQRNIKPIKGNIMHFLIIETKPCGSHMIDKADSTYSTTYQKVLKDYNIDEAFIDRIKNEKCIHFDGIKSRDEVISRTFIFVKG